MIRILRYWLRFVLSWGYRMSDKSKKYDDLPYDRLVVTSSGVKDAVKDAMGFKDGDIDKLIFDGKVTPVVLVNKRVQFQARVGVAMVVPNNLWTTVVFDVVDIDDVGYDNSNGIFTVNVKGKYCFGSSLVMQTAVLDCNLWMNIFGPGGLQYGALGYVDRLYNGGASVSCVMDLDVGDQVRVDVQQLSGQPASVLTDSGFWGVRLL